MPRSAGRRILSPDRPPPESTREAAIADPEAPAGWVVRFAPLIPSGQPVLDVACGGGRHTRFFLERGHPVTAVDVNTEPIAALKRYPGLEIVRADLEHGGPWPLPGRRFAGVVVTNYLWRPLFPHLIAALAPGGLLLYDTFAVGNAALRQAGAARVPARTR